MAARQRLKAWWYGRKLPGWLERARRQDAWIILCYHRFERKPGLDPIPGMAVTPEAFSRQMELLQEVGQIVSLDEGLVGGNGLRFSITFDDGYLDNAQLLPGLLEHADACATIYCTSDFVMGRMMRMNHDAEIGVEAPPMTPAQLKELAANPRIRIGAHGATHCRFVGLLQEQWGKELGEVKNELETVLEVPVLDFAYTFGPLQAFDWDRGPAEVKQAGFRSLASNAGGWNPAGPPERQPVHLRRVPAIAETDRDLFLGWVLDSALRARG